MQPPPNALKYPIPAPQHAYTLYPVGVIRAAASGCDLPLPSPLALGSPRVYAYLVPLPAAPQNHIENRNENGERDQNAAPQDVAGAAVATDMRTKEEFESKDEGVWTSTPADRVGSRPRVEILRSGSGSGGIHIRMWDEWDVDPTGALPLVGAPGAAVRMRGGVGWGLIYSHESTAHGSQQRERVIGVWVGGAGGHRAGHPALALSCSKPYSVPLLSLVGLLLLPPRVLFHALISR
ncbi:hypothetical protein B0H14DRAFT_3467124 [Mycena olivaceomarginata]|nr:hypothetical protein B0H14DRAFT_3467124 [Mycena olivaceomarginata]